MDLSFANQALRSSSSAARAGRLDATVMSVPKEIDQHVAALKLESLGVTIDGLTAEQQRYLAS